MDLSVLQNRNTNISQFRGCDLRELLVDVENTPFYYRDILNMNKKLLFGLEIEWEGKYYDLVQKFLHMKMKNWQIEYDGSLNNGGEVKSPKLHDNLNTWKVLKEVCLYLKKHGASVNERTGAHIHFGANIFESDFTAFLLFLKTYAVYENIFFRFFYGEFLSHRDTFYTRNQKLAWQIRKNIESIKTIDDVNSHFSFLRNDRNYAMNFMNLKFGDKEKEKNTIELRIPNGSVEEVIWQNNINAFGKFIVAIIEEKIDQDYINQKFLEITEDSLNPIFYNEICLAKSLELVDLMFDNDLDKFYFLKQYLKNYESNYGLKENRLAKRFIQE